MIIRKAFKYKLKTTPGIEQQLSMMAGCSRLVWNKALAMSLNRLQNKQSIIWYNESAFWLKFWKSTTELCFLKDCHSQVLQQTLKNLERAFRDAFNKKQPNKRNPVFKHKGQYDSFSYPQGFKIEGSRVFQYFSAGPAC
ncbi:MAG: helix-turn-helix domain-containing protein [bacterium]|nr:helix-turn-helix domain-containing protein [bacterium]